MKRVFALSLLLVFALSCGSKEQKAVRNYLKENLDDPKSYESISFSGSAPYYVSDYFFDCYCPDFSDYLENGLPDIEQSEEESLEQFGERLIKASRMASEYFLLEQMKKDYDTTRVMFYGITHEYRIKNRYGGVEKRRETFYLSPEELEVVGVHDVTDSRSSLSDMREAISHTFPEWEKYK